MQRPASATKAVAPTSLADLEALAPFLLITRHDYRTAMQVNLHHCAEHLRRYGPVCFFSVGFSWLSFLTRDARLPLWTRSNRIETIDGIDCFLWRTFVHPFNIRLSKLGPLAAKLFAAYGRNFPPELRDIVVKSRYIVIESGLGVVFVEAIRRINPTARIAYFASDDLVGIGCSPALHHELIRTIHHYDAVFSPSKRLARQFSGAVPTYHLPYGIDPVQLDNLEASPYSGGLNAVTAGASQFDPMFFRIAASILETLHFT